ncbi:hypothetical protein SPRG_17444, partial [Saprolegnia parasitica CBS 223.65]
MAAKRKAQAATLVEAPPAKRSTRSSTASASTAPAPVADTKPTPKAKTVKSTTKAAAKTSTKATPETNETTLTPAAIKDEEDFQ